MTQPFEASVEDNLGGTTEPFLAGQEVIADTNPVEGVSERVPDMPSVMAQKIEIARDARRLGAQVHIAHSLHIRKGPNR